MQILNYGTYLVYKKCRIHSIWIIFLSLSIQMKKINKLNIMC